jgi:hypothetical protein
MADKHIDSDLYDLMRKELTEGKDWKFEHEDKHTGLSTSTKNIFNTSLPCYKIENAFPEYPIHIVWATIKDVGI